MKYFINEGDLYAFETEEDFNEWFEDEADNMPSGEPAWVITWEELDDIKFINKKETNEF